jgi:hypothetical protein
VGHSSPALLRHGALMALGASGFDAGARSIAAHLAADLVREQRGILAGRYVQTIAIIQPIDMLPDGEENMCEGCPDMTVDRGELVWSCRTDERLRYGCFLTAAPRGTGGAS